MGELAQIHHRSGQTGAVRQGFECLQIFEVAADELVAESRQIGVVPETVAGQIPVTDAGGGVGRKKGADVDAHVENHISRIPQF